MIIRRRLNAMTFRNENELELPKFGRISRSSKSPMKFGSGLGFMTSAFGKVLAVLVVGLSCSAATALEAVKLVGDLVQGGLAFGKTEVGAKVRLDGRQVKVGPEGRYLIGFRWDNGPRAALEIVYPDGRRQVQELEIRPQEYKIERIDGLPPKTVTIPEEERKRRARERALVGKARAENTDSLDWLEGFIRPAEGRISGVYGSYRILNGKPRSPHYGLDIAAPVSTPIIAPAAGTVTLAESDFLLEGGIVIIDHGFGLTSTLFHMNSVEVRLGQRVERGEKIGTVGAKGRASGPHVDWRINLLDLRLDPALLQGPAE